MLLTVTFRNCFVSAFRWVLTDSDNTLVQTSPNISDNKVVKTFIYFEDIKVQGDEPTIDYDLVL